jgi:tRNA nucleotidyltransferase/poly(A) polymerase
LNPANDNLLERLDDRHREILVLCGRAAADRNEKAYLVGGSVRDLILERPHDDLDIVVEGDGLAVAQVVSRALQGELTRHHAFQTATVATPTGTRVDVAPAARIIRAAGSYRASRRAPWPTTWSAATSPSTPWRSRWRRTSGAPSSTRSAATRTSRRGASG